MKRRRKWASGPSNGFLGAGVVCSAAFLSSERERESERDTLSERIDREGWIGQGGNLIVLSPRPYFVPSGILIDFRSVLVVMPPFIPMIIAGQRRLHGARQDSQDHYYIITAFGEMVCKLAEGSWSKNSINQQLMRLMKNAWLPWQMILTI